MAMSVLSQVADAEDGEALFLNVTFCSGADPSDLLCLQTLLLPAAHRSDSQGQYS